MKLMVENVQIVQLNCNKEYIVYIWDSDSDKDMGARLMKTNRTMLNNSEENASSVRKRTSNLLTNAGGKRKKCHPI